MLTEETGACTPARSLHVHINLKLGLVVHFSEWPWSVCRRVHEMGENGEQLWALIALTRKPNGSFEDPNPTRAGEDPLPDEGPFDHLTGFSHEGFISGVDQFLGLPCKMTEYKTLTAHSAATLTSSSLEGGEAKWPCRPRRPSL